ncbi:TPA: hypothetical protein N2854_001511 [Vibrio parahaemolyticus]|uniref:hypothetical protein n=1 Tax=Vibrio parahaemolyticus TaxID=670 RepID=UPI000761FF50|nr:hypothetical protein [Vibrio parahaemolyticus]KWU35341.1 hypothetical protein AVL51_00525 [Vibrio parahaemolyticus]HCM1019895.1 hypothetical protein [Vibrio parahaemolyticus]HCM1046813.1 hypothetical protein [Vibrio parahaemolyticus]HCM1052231.1 hypothetical protein [Vibrio parahaemolyticus]HCM1089435.1 hypothetical protein [Vibrio parahaemolyticus]
MSINSTNENTHHNTYRVTEEHHANENSVIENRTETVQEQVQNPTEIDERKLKAQAIKNEVKKLQEMSTDFINISNQKNEAKIVLKQIQDLNKKVTPLLRAFSNSDSPNVEEDEIVLKGIEIIILNENDMIKTKWNEHVADSKEHNVKPKSLITNFIEKLESYSTEINSIGEHNFKEEKSQLIDQFYEILNERFLDENVSLQDTIDALSSLAVLTPKQIVKKNKVVKKTATKKQK